MFLHINPTANKTTKEIRQLIPPLTHQFKDHLTKELNPTDKDIPQSSRPDSGYILLLITLLFAKDVTLNNSHPNNFPHEIDARSFSQTLQQMHTIESTSPTYGPLTRQWVDNIINHRLDLIKSLPNELKALYDSITKIPTSPEPKSPGNSSSSSSLSNMSIEEQMSIG